MANSKIYIGTTNIGSLFEGTSDVSIYLGANKVYPLEVPLKFQATYIGGETYSAECDGNITLSTIDTKPSGYEYSSMTDSIIGDCITAISDASFDRCISLTSVTISSGVTYIGLDVFKGCSGLTSVAIPDNVTTIGSYAFSGCSSLTSITIPSGVTVIDVALLQLCSSLTSVTLPSGVTSINSVAFSNCSRLTSITLYDNVTDIGNYAFYGCTALRAVYIYNPIPPTLGSFAFYATNNCPIYVPSESVELYKSATNWNSYASRIVSIPNN